MTRLTWDEYFLSIAGAVALRADCTRRQVGAVIVQRNRIVATGYNGAPAGELGCLSAGACPRGKHREVLMLGYSLPWCSCGNEWPCADASEPGTQYQNCIAVHAEANALLYADRDRCEGATMYVTCAPCVDCTKLIRGAGITRVTYPTPIKRDV